MSRYYFNLREDDEVVSDEEGVELPTIESARDAAIRGLADCARDAICNAGRARIAVEVLDEKQLNDLPGFKKRMEWFLKNRSDLAGQISGKGVRLDKNQRALHGGRSFLR